MVGILVDNYPGSPKYQKRNVNRVDLIFGVESPGDKDNKNRQIKNSVDFDDLLPHIGNFGTYQIILFLLLAPYTLFYVFVYFTQIFITLIPNNYWCNVPELQHLELSDR